MKTCEHEWQCQSVVITARWSSEPDSNMVIHYKICPKCDLVFKIGSDYYDRINVPRVGS